MRTPDRLPDEALESLLDGSPSEEATGTPLAAYLEAVRHDAATTQYRPSVELGMVLSEGLDPAELDAGGILADAAVAGTAPWWRRRARTVRGALTAKVAALSLLSKAAAAGAAVTVAASGAGAAGVLPPPAQSTFNEVIGREAPPAAEADGVTVDGDEGHEGADTPPETPASTADTVPLDMDVPGDATGSTDGEPGVDGRGVAEDASDGRSNAADDADGQPAGPQDTPAGDRVQDTPAGQAPASRPAEGGSSTGDAVTDDVELGRDDAQPSKRYRKG